MSETAYTPDREKELQELYTKLGKAYYEGGFEDPLPELLPLFDRITGLKAQAEAEAKAAEEARKAAEAKAAEEARKAAEAKAAEEARKAAEAQAAAARAAEEAAATGDEDATIMADPEEETPPQKPAAKKWCTQCGSQLSENAAFCWNCGHPVR